MPRKQVYSLREKAFLIEMFMSGVPVSELNLKVSFRTFYNYLNNFGYTYERSQGWKRTTRGVLIDDSALPENFNK